MAVIRETTMALSRTGRSPRCNACNGRTPIVLPGGNLGMGATLAATAALAAIAAPRAAFAIRASPIAALASLAALLAAPVVAPVVAPVAAPVAAPAATVTISDIWPPPGRARAAGRCTSLR